MHPIRCLAALALVALAPTAAAAQEMHACYVPKSGTVYRIQVQNSPIKCSTNHVAFSWSAAGQVGPEGPQGPQGPEGPQGPAGTAGTSGLAGYDTWQGGYTVDPGETETVVHTCPGGGRIISGGYTVGSELQLLANHPLTDKTGWTFVAYNPGTGFGSLQTWIICVNA